MREINVETINGMSREKIYEIEELPLLQKMLDCTDSHKRNVNYLNIPCAFDIETTNIVSDYENNSFIDISVYNYIKGSTLKYSAAIKKDIADFESLRRSYFGKIKLSNRKGTPIDTYYDEIKSIYPYYFPEEIINPSDQLLKILEVFDDNKPLHEDFRPYAFMYHWQFCIDDCVCFGRTWEEFMTLIRTLEKRMNLSLSNRLVIYVHNLPFEWAFCNRFINYHEGFFREERKPLKIVTDEGIEFRCSYALSNMSLGKFCENEEGVIHYKLSGDDYDYMKLRTPSTKLTEYEEGYCYNDVRGLCECIRSKLKYDTMAGMPLTSTGYVRRDLRESVRGDKKYRTLFRNNALDSHLYTLCREAFRGGDTHANLDFVDQTIHNVHSRDITSSYPATMMMGLFPQTAFFKVNPSTFANRDMSEFALLMEVRFVNIRYRGNCGIPYIAAAKCRKFTEDHLIDNGRILYANVLEAVITDIDYNIILSEYAFDDVFMKEIWASRYAPLNDNIKNTVMEYYRLKTLLKGNEEKIYEYSKNKNKVNACFGCFVMRIDMPEIRYDDSTHEYITTENDLDETLAKFYKNRNNFLSYQHGLWITAGSRMRLRKMLHKVGEAVIYCDTDSIKFIGDKHESEFEEMNKTIIQEALAAGAYAETAEGEVKYMGVWDDETITKTGEKHLYEEFRVLGAKKYVYRQGDKITSTIAGVNKKAGAKFFKENGIEAFEIDTKIENSGHLTAYYNDVNIHEITVNGETFLSASNVALVDNTYTIGVTGEYEDLILKALDNRTDLEYI